MHKVLSTPDDPARAILAGISQVASDANLARLVHGSTLATNAVLEQTGARTGLITTAGFRDVLEIGRQTRPALYDLRVTRRPPLVERSLRREVTERLDERGSVLTPLDPASVTAAVSALAESGVESVAICLLFSFANPAHELAVVEAMRRAGMHASVSAEVIPEFREYERTSTVVLNAYVAPLMDRYLGHLEAALPRGYRCGSCSQTVAPFPLLTPLDMVVGQMLSSRPLPGWANYRTPIAGLYLCGAGTHPGGDVTGAPGHNAARAILTDLGRIAG